ncbi:MAG: BolA family protein [Sulfuricaulis sp.]
MKLEKTSFGSDRVIQIENRLRDAFTPEKLTVRDDSHRHAGHEGAKSGGGHFAVTIVSAQFEGKSALQRHQMIYQALGGMMPNDIHALSIQALTLDEA